MADFVTIFIDDKEVKVPKGTNLIEAAKLAGIEIPHYCYHPHLSVAGNCRMCQVAVEGQPKLTIACNTGATEGMKVHTQETSADVADAQRATLEFLLINHPLDCTVCDAAGHCKLQDYYYEYDSRSSRFIENKNHKVKAEVLGPEIIYDGERCILCTRCVRFCDEVTKTSELGLYNRGDKGVIGTHPDRVLDNPLSGTVADLCPVGALTHRRWRFNTRIWYTSSADSVCPGCSTGCNVKAHVRDDAVVYVKGRANDDVNKEWLCDEGRYGFGRFQPARRLTAPAIRNDDGSFFGASWQDAFLAASGIKSLRDQLAVFVSPFLTLEEYYLTAEFLSGVLGIDPRGTNVALQLRGRALTPEQAVLISPDYAPNARGWHFLFHGTAGGETWREDMEAQYNFLLDAVQRNQVGGVLLIGDYSIALRDLDSGLLEAIGRLPVSAAFTPRAFGSDDGGAEQACRVLFPSRTVNEKSGALVNQALRIQRLQSLLSAPAGTLPEWMIMARFAEHSGKPILGKDVTEERALFREMTKGVEPLSTLSLRKIGPLGLSLLDVLKSEEASVEAAASVSA